MKQRKEEDDDDKGHDHQDGEDVDNWRHLLGKEWNAVALNWGPAGPSKFWQFVFLEQLELHGCIPSRLSVPSLQKRWPFRKKVSWVVVAVVACPPEQKLKLQIQGNVNVEVTSVVTALVVLHKSLFFFSKIFEKHRILIFAFVFDLIEDEFFHNQAQVVFCSMYLL